ncbi:MAG: glycerophosphodiester phosphodiesterase [Bryobacterales bacterium]|nr:glycerophosphodiester phosphodiesterase [Bryobacterales bacterium]
MHWFFLLTALPLLVLPLASQEAKPPAKRILVEGHRGARWVLPENTIPAMHHAMEMGADVLEMDLSVTKDNVLVLSHDAVMNPAICKGPDGMSRVIRELTLAELKQFDCGWAPNPGFPAQQALPGTRMPTLEEIFQEFAAIEGVQFNIETKIDPRKPELTPSPEEFSRMLVDLVRKYKMEKRVIVQSFDFRTLHAVRKLAPELRRSALLGMGEESFVETSKRAGDAPIVSPHFRLVTPAKVKDAQAAGLKVVAWTANTPAEWQPLIDAGVDSIITDNPQGLILYLEERNLR